MGNRYLRKGEIEMIADCNKLILSFLPRYQRGSRTVAYSSIDPIELIPFLIYPPLTLTTAASACQLANYPPTSTSCAITTACQLTIYLCTYLPPPRGSYELGAMWGMP